jgi:hypothetical protein
MSAPQPVIRLNPDSPAAKEQLAFAKLREDPHLYDAIRTVFVQRRESRRLALEQSDGEKAIALRGRCAELTEILREMFPEKG